MYNAIFMQYPGCSKHFHWLSKKFIVFIQSCSPKRIGFAKNILHISYGIFRTPYIWRLERLLTAILNIVHDAVCYKANRIKCTFLINPSTIPRNSYIILLFFQKSPNQIIIHLLALHSKIHYYYPH